jgi:hypothetical protein
LLGSQEEVKIPEKLTWSCGVSQEMQLLQAARVHIDKMKWNISFSSLFF